MRKRTILYVGIILLIFSLSSCYLWFVHKIEVVWEGDLGGSILFEYSRANDFDIHYQVEDVDYFLAGIAAIDCNEDLVIMEVSPDEKHLVLLVENSTRAQYPHGTRLWIFDLSVLPDGAEFEPLLDIIDTEVLDATIDNEKVDYQIPGESREYRF